jgi:hypothetical protein
MPSRSSHSGVRSSVQKGDSWAEPAVYFTHGSLPARDSMPPSRTTLPQVAFRAPLKLGCVPHMRIDCDCIRFRTASHGFDFRDATIVGDPPSFFEPELQPDQPL